MKKERCLVFACAKCMAPLYIRGKSLKEKLDKIEKETECPNCGEEMYGSWPDEANWKFAGSILMNRLNRPSGQEEV